MLIVSILQKTFSKPFNYLLLTPKQNLQKVLLGCRISGFCNTRNLILFSFWHESLVRYRNGFLNAPSNKRPLLEI